MNFFSKISNMFSGVVVKENSDNPSSEEVSDSTPKVTDRCCGNSRTTRGIWFCPKGKKPNECTYCQYCVRHGCVALTDVYQLDKIGHCNCDCTNEKCHPVFENMVCPCCAFDRGTFCVQILSSCDGCKAPVHNPSVKYCNTCTYLLNVCQMCGNKIVDGNSYIEMIYEKLNEEITYIDLELQSDNISSDRRQMLETRKARFTTQKQEVQDRYKDKPVSEMIRLIKK